MKLFPDLKKWLTAVSYTHLDVYKRQSYKVLTSSKEGIPSKPAPDIFLETAKRLNVDPKNCLVLEDSKNGIIAAAGAHMHSIFVPDQIVPDEEMKPYIQTTCQSLKDVIPYLENQPAMV